MSPLDRPLRGRPKGLRRCAAWAGTHPFPKHRLSAVASYALLVGPRGSGPATEPGSPQPSVPRGRTVAGLRPHLAFTARSRRAFGPSDCTPFMSSAAPRAKRRPGGRRSPWSRFASSRPRWAAHPLTRRVGSLVLSTRLGRQADPLRGRLNSVGAAAPTAGLSSSQRRRPEARPQCCESTWPAYGGNPTPCISAGAARRAIPKHFAPNTQKVLSASLGTGAARLASRGHCSPHAKLGLHARHPAGAARYTRPRGCAPDHCAVLRARLTNCPARSAYTQQGAPLKLKVLRGADVFNNFGALQ